MQAPVSVDGLLASGLLLGGLQLLAGGGGGSTLQGIKSVEHKVVESG